MSQAQPDLEERLNADQTQNEHSTGLGLAADSARGKSLDADQLQSREFLETFTDPDVDRDGEKSIGLEEFLAAEFSPQLQFGQITRDEYEEEKAMDKARELLSLCQFADPQGLGSGCQGTTRARMTGGEADDYRPMNDDRRQQIRAAFEVRSMQRSGSIDGRVLSGLFEAIAVARNEGFEFDFDQGTLAKLTGGLVG